MNASIMFGDTITYDAKKQVTLNLNSDQELIQKHNILCQFWLSASIKKICIKMVQVYFSDAQGQLSCRQ